MNVVFWSMKSRSDAKEPKTNRNYFLRSEAYEIENSCHGLFVLSQDIIKSGNYMRVLDMYYASGNYEAFARPRKPEGVESKSAYIIGTGLAALTAACYLVRDG